MRSDERGIGGPARAAAAAVLAVAALAGLSCYDPTLADCTVRCDPGVGCPSPLSCVAGFCTAGTSCEPDGGPAPTSCLPEAPSSVVLWLEASMGVSADQTGHVDLWRDQSVWENHASQELPEAKPTLTLNAIRGLPALTFDGNLTFMLVQDAPSVQWGFDDWAVLLVAKYINRTGDELPVFFQKSDMTYAQGPSLYLNPYDGDGGRPERRGRDGAGRAQRRRCRVAAAPRRSDLDRDLRVVRRCQPVPKSCGS